MGFEYQNLGSLDFLFPQGSGSESGVLCNLDVWLWDSEEGLALVDRNSKPEIIVLPKVDDLPKGTQDRFNSLFSRREKWTEGDITPYIQKSFLRSPKPRDQRELARQPDAAQPASRRRPRPRTPGPTSGFRPHAGRTSWDARVLGGGQHVGGQHVGGRAALVRDGDRAEEGEPRGSERFLPPTGVESSGMKRKKGDKGFESPRPRTFPFPGLACTVSVFNKLLSLASTASSQKFQSHMWSQMLVSTYGFLKSISNVSGKDIQPLIKQWVDQSGVVKFYGSFAFNRKRNVLELEIKQDYTSPGTQKYVGPLKVTVQELDGSFNHTLQIEENSLKHDIPCHSKSRRNKKKKIPLMNGEEVDMDLSAMDADSPLLWIRIDPDMSVLRKVEFEQADFMWQYELRYERDVVAQQESILALEKFPTPASRLALTDILEQEQCFYRVRMSACFCLAKVRMHGRNCPMSVVHFTQRL
ncbi:TATA-box binding protein associated factor 2 [Cricetulus griseus]